MRVLIIGSGAREHAMGEALKRNESVELFVFGATLNPGLKPLASDYRLGSVTDSAAIVAFGQEVGAQMAIIGPEAPIAAGVVDALEAAAIPCCSPLRATGQLESSKGFTRMLLEKYGIAGNPRFKTFTSEAGLRDFFEELGEDYVVKADGLHGGKGVKVSGDHLHGMEEGIAFALECLASDGRVVIEEKLVGQEFSLMSFCDGVTTVDMPAIQDHKRAFDGDKGPNTGGMGTYSCADHSLPFLRPEDIAAASAITRAVAAAVHRETGVKFKGVMYGGFMAVKDGVRLIEYNARFGDPEAMNIFSLLESDFLALCQAIIDERLNEVAVRFASKATVCKYVVPEGYPDDGVKGVKIEIGALPKSVRAYYSSVEEKADGLYLCGSRAVAFVGVGETLAEAEALAEAGAAAVSGAVFYRKDIGTAKVIAEKSEIMKELRS